MSPVMYDVEMHEDDDFQKTLDMADESKPKKVRVNFNSQDQFQTKTFCNLLVSFFYSLHENQFNFVKTHQNIN